MGYISRIAAAVRNTDGQPAAARVNGAGETIVTPWLYQMALEGRVFSAGTGLEETGEAAPATVADTTPTFALVSPAGGKILIPIVFRQYNAVEAAAAPKMHLAYVSTDKAAFDAGTVMPSINHLGGSGTPTAAGHFEHTLTVSAFTDNENILLTERELIVDNFQSAEAVTGDANQETPGRDVSPFELQYNFAQKEMPFALQGGSFIAMFSLDATSRYKANMTWVELDQNTYKAFG